MSLQSSAERAVKALEGQGIDSLSGGIPINLPQTAMATPTGELR